MTIDRRFVGWGIFLILAGLVPLLARTGALDPGIAGRAISLWPLFIVALGLGLVLRDTPVDWIGGLLAVGTGGLIVGGVLTSGFGGAGICSDPRPGPEVPVASSTMIGRGSFTIDLPCGDLDVHTRAGSTWSVSTTGSDGRPPRVQDAGNDVTVDSARAPVTGFFLDRVGSNARWVVELPTDPTIDVAVSVDAGSARLDLAGGSIGELRVGVNAGSARIDGSQTATLGSLRVEVNAGDVRISLPAQSVTGRLEANAASLAICVPADVGIVIRLEDNLSVSNDFGSRGLIQVGERWETRDAASAVNLIDLSIEANAASIALNPEDGC